MESAAVSVSLDRREPLAGPDGARVAGVANRLALGVAAGLIAVLVHGEATRLSTHELTWGALLGR